MRDKNPTNWRLFGILYLGNLVLGLPFLAFIRVLAGFSVESQIPAAAASVVSSAVMFYFAIRILNPLHVDPRPRQGPAWLGRIAVLYGTLLALTIAGFHLFRGGSLLAGQNVLQLLLIFAVRCVGLTIFTSIYFYVVRKDVEAREVQRLATLEQLAQGAEIDRLKAQINPHFLFNALASIVGKTTQPEIEQMAQGLADLLRYNLSHAGVGARFEVEARAIQSYLKVEQLRFGDRLRVEFAVTPEAGAAVVPQPLLLSVVENAIKYGQRTAAGPLLIRIGVRVEGGIFIATVENTGRWVEPVTPAPAGTQIGLSNLKRRLELLSRGQARVEHESRPDTVCVTVSWPLGVAL